MSDFLLSKPYHPDTSDSYKQNLSSGQRSILALMLLASLVLMSGCGTVLARSDSSPVDARYYPGTQGSLLLLGLDGHTGEASGEMVFCWMSVVCPLFTLVTLPVDITLDTLLLPYDALKPGTEGTDSGEALP